MPRPTERMAYELSWEEELGVKKAARMSDIVELMRDRPTSYELKHGIDPQTTKIWDALFLKAADEIERLRADAENGWTARDHWKQKCQAAEAVVEAARVYAKKDSIKNLHILNDSLDAHDAYDADKGG